VDTSGRSATLPAKRLASMVDKPVLIILGLLIVANAYILVRVAQGVADKDATVPHIVSLILDLIAIGLILAVRRGWTYLAAAVMGVVVLAGSASHDVPPILHPDTLEHMLFSIVEILLLVATISAGLLAFVRHRHSAA
jgi:uncharacterized membrane protein YjgN (DUF898 family)